MEFLHHTSYNYFLIQRWKNILTANAILMFCNSRLVHYLNTATLVDFSKRNYWRIASSTSLSVSARVYVLDTCCMLGDTEQ